MIIELLGVPASGKSTTEERIRDSLQRFGVRIFDQSEVERIYIAFYGPFRVLGSGLSEFFGRLWFYLRLCTETLIRLGFKLSFYAILDPVKFKTSYWLVKDRVLHRYFLSLPNLQIKSGAVYLTSEGIAQHAAGVMVWCGESFYKFASLLLRETTTSKLVVVSLTLPLEEAIKRGENRSLPESWPKRQTNLESLYRKYFKAVELIEDQLGNSATKILNGEQELDSWLKSDQLSV